MRRTFNAARLGLVAALEQEEIKAEEQAAVEAPIGDNADSLETDLIEVTEMAADNEADEAATDEAVEVAEALEAIADSLGHAAAHGGVDKHSAFAVNTAVQHLYQRVGIVAASPAMESFGGTSSRIQATQVAMEDIREQVKKIWDAIVAFLNKAIAAAVAFYNSVFDASTKMAERAKVLVAKAEAIKGEAKENTFENETLAAKLHIGGQIKVDGIESVVEVATNVFGKAAHYANELGDEIAADLSDSDIGKVFNEKFSIEPHGTDMSKEVTDPSGEGYATPAEGLALFRGEELPGGQAVFFMTPKGEVKGQAAVDLVGGIGAKVMPFNTKAGAPKAEIATLSAADAVKMAKAVQELAAKVLEYKAMATKLDEVKKKIAAASAALGKKTPETDEEKSGLKNAQKVASSVARWIDSPAKDFARYSLITGKAHLDYVELSLKQFA